MKNKMTHDFKTLLSLTESEWKSFVSPRLREGWFNFKPTINSNFLFKMDDFGFITHFNN